MLSIWVLNVGHGDSIVLRYDGPSGSSFGVVDSNAKAGRPPPALEKLESLGAERLSFVALTHPHADHYTGLSKIIERFAGEIDHLYTFPVDAFIEGRRKDLAALYAKFAQSTESRTIKSQAIEFIKILRLAEEAIGLDRWEEPAGTYNRLFPVGFEGVELIATLPPKKAKGSYFRRIVSGDYGALDYSNKQNQLSLAFTVKYGGAEIVLGGDGTFDNWMFQRRQWQDNDIPSNATVVKLPHHGSKHDCTEGVLDHVFAESGDRVAVASADGKRHPHPETYKALADRSIKPYCTNLATECGAKVRTLLNVPDLDWTLRRYLNTYAEPKESAIQACQGDIEIRISPEEGVAIVPQFNHACPYRLPDLFA